MVENKLTKVKVLDIKDIQRPKKFIKNYLISNGHNLYKSLGIHIYKIIVAVHKLKPGDNNKPIEGGG